MTITIADGRGALWQWDTGRRVKITDGDGVKQIHYQNRCFGCSVDVDVGDDGTAIIPDELLQDWHTLTAYAYVTDDAGAYTMVQQDFAVYKRAKPADYVFTPVEQTTIAEIAAIAQSVRDDADAGRFDGAQADWNQNDETKPDYIKNRPFYTGGPVETVFVEESTVSFADDGGIYVAKFPSTFMPTVGETYKVYWDGTVYECTCVAFPGGTTLGNLSITDAGSDTGEPFILEIDNDGFIYISTADTSASHTISISRDAEAESVVKIDRKYLPKAAVITHNSISNTYSSDITAEELHEILSDGKQVVYCDTNKIGYNYLISWEETPTGRIDLTFGGSVSVSLFSDGTIGEKPVS